MLDLRFSGQTATDAAGGRTPELINVVVMGSGSAAYGDLDGRGAVVVPADPELSFAAQDSFWMEAWINPVQFGKTGTLVSKGGGANYRLSSPANGLFGFSYYSQGAWRSLASETPLAPNEWQHVAVFFDPSTGTVTLFRNGKVVARKTGFPPFQSRDDAPLYLGGTPVKDSEDFSGMVGALGPVTIARGNPREIPAEVTGGQQAFEIQSPFSGFGVREWYRNQNTQQLPDHHTVGLRGIRKVRQPPCSTAGCGKPHVRWCGSPDWPNPVGCRTNFFWEFPEGDEISQPRVAKLPWVL
ncbi:MAG: LamG domain-containing protein [Bacteroidales bacterium]|nr:LamG domain-containing protein [Bacteroidales bacterium]